MFRYRLKLVLLSLGAIFGFASAYRHMGHGHDHGHCDAPWHGEHHRHGWWSHDADDHAAKPHSAPSSTGAAKQVQ